MVSQSLITDSIKELLKNANHDTTRCNILNTLIESESNDSVWPKLNEQLLKISGKNINHSNQALKKYFLKHYANALNNKGFYKMQIGEVFSAYEYYYQALSIQKEIGDKQGIAYGLINLGYLLRQEGNIAQAIDSYHQALKIQLVINDVLGAATSYNNIGFIFDNQGESFKALEYYQKALALYSKINDKDGTATCYANIAYIYKEYGDPECKESKHLCQKISKEKALNYLNRAIKIREELKDKVGLANSLNLLGGIYDSYSDSLCMADLNCRNETKQKALDTYLKALNLRIESAHLSGIIQSYTSLAEHKLKYNELDLALEYAKKCLEKSYELGAPERIRDASYILKIIYNKKKRYQESLTMFELYIQMRDSILNEGTKNIAIKKGFQIEYEKKTTADSVRVAEEKKLISVQLKQEKTQRFALYGGLILVGLFGAFMYNRFQIKKKQNKLINIQKAELQKQKELVEEHQKETIDSIHYAKRIQTALISNSEFISQSLKQNFIFFNPKDIVSGDFYWATKHQNKFYLAVCDSTGHGVPGAFMSLLNMGFLSEAIKEKNIEKPNEIFNYVRNRLISTISESGQKDGMDGILICYDSDTQIIEYAAANNHPVIIRNNEIIELAKDKMPVGTGEKTESFTLHTLHLNSADTLYLYTDGFADQFGGPKGKKFKYKPLNELLLSIRETPMELQKEKLESTFNLWKGEQEQVDDVLIIGIKI